jgi:general secretion pathway protein D
VLQEIPSQQGAAGSVGGAGGTGTGASSRAPTAVVLGKVQINADKATNSLIVMADKEDYEVVEAVIKKLDIPRSMVYIESLIMEVNAQKSLDIGIRWQLFEDTRINNNRGVYGGGFSGTSTAASAVSGLVNPTGLALGMLTEPFTIGGVTVSNITAIINAVKTDDDFRILSTPQILTTDNEEARITVGENRPFQTRATTDVSGGTFESFEYRDVGKILKITPHVSEGRNVRLKLSLEVTALDRVATVATTASRPVTQKRTIDTTVLVQDNHTIVIGGLIDDSRNNNETKVPGLGDIPLLGWLFKTQSKGEEKTNLYIFLTPRVIKSPAEADRILSEKRQTPDNIPAMLQKGEITLENPSDAARPIP